MNRPWVRWLGWSAAAAAGVAVLFALRAVFAPFILALVVAYVLEPPVRMLHRRGLGRVLLERLLEHYAHVRQRVLLTDADPAQHAFYTGLGFTESRGHPSGPLHAFVQLATTSPD